MSEAKILSEMSPPLLGELLFKIKKGAIEGIDCDVFGSGLVGHIATLKKNRSVDAVSKVVGWIDPVFQSFTDGQWEQLKEIWLQSGNIPKGWKINLEKGFYYFEDERMGIVSQMAIHQRHKGRIVHGPSREGKLWQCYLAKGFVPAKKPERRSTIL